VPYQSEDEDAPCLLCFRLALCRMGPARMDNLLDGHPLALLMMFFLSSVGFSQVEVLVDLAGLFQRITLTIGWLWLTLLAVHFLRASSEIPATK
jgi:hypothetical protein